MSKEMNNLERKITKYDMLVGLFMSLIISLVFSFKPAIVFFLGVQYYTSIVIFSWNNTRPRNKTLLYINSGRKCLGWNQ